MKLIADTPKPPYYAVIFTSHQTSDIDGYGKTSQRMEELASKQPGYLGIEAARQEVGITISYWTDLDSIRNWKAELEHLEAQRTGRDKWYSSYQVRIARVERDYGFDADSS